MALKDEGTRDSFIAAFPGFGIKIAGLEGKPEILDVKLFTNCFELICYGQVMTNYTATTMNLKSLIQEPATTEIYSFEAMPQHSSNKQTTTHIYEFSTTPAIMEKLRSAFTKNNLFQIIPIGTWTMQFTPGITYVSNFKFRLSQAQIDHNKVIHGVAYNSKAGVKSKEEYDAEAKKPGPSKGRTYGTRHHPYVRISHLLTYKILTTLSFVAISCREIELSASWRFYNKFSVRKNFKAEKHEFLLFSSSEEKLFSTYSRKNLHLLHFKLFIIQKLISIPNILHEKSFNSFCISEILFFITELHETLLSELYETPSSILIKKRITTHLHLSNNKKVFTHTRLISFFTKLNKTEISNLIKNKESESKNFSLTRIICIFSYKHIRIIISQTMKDRRRLRIDGFPKNNDFQLNVAQLNCQKKPNPLMNLDNEMG